MSKRYKKGIKTKPKVISNDEWIRKNFEKLVDKFGGQHIIVSCGEVFTGDNALKEARKKYPNAIPTSMPVPTPQDLICAL